MNEMQQQPTLVTFAYQLSKAISASWQGPFQLLLMHDMHAMHAQLNHPCNSSFSLDFITPS